jgi:predicted nucleic acid-binding protein
MSYLLDTNAISEWVKPQPDPGIVRWFDEVDEDRSYLSVITLGELRKGVDRLAKGRRRDRLEQWLTDELPERFGERMLPVDVAIADEWGRALAHAENCCRRHRRSDRRYGEGARPAGRDPQCCPLPVPGRCRDLALAKYLIGVGDDAKHLR